MFRSEEIPDYLQCTISLMMFFEPVTVFPSGHTFEKKELEKLINLAKANGKTPLCPLSRMPIERYVTTWAIKAAVNDYIKAHSQAVGYQYKDDEAIIPNQKKSESSNASASVDVSLQIQSDEVLARKLAKEYADSSRSSSAAVPYKPASAKPVITKPDSSSDDSSDDSVVMPVPRKPVNAKPRQSIFASLFSKFTLSRSSSSVKYREESSSDSESSSDEVPLSRKPVSAKYREESSSDSDSSDDSEIENHKKAPSSAAKIVSTSGNNRIVKLNLLDETARVGLINEIKNVIYALGFESYPLPKGKTSSSPVCSAVRDAVSHKLLPWQKIKVDKGPKYFAMYDVLQACILSLASLDPEILYAKKLRHYKKYDCVQTKSGELSLSHYHCAYASTETLEYQPGYHVNKILFKVEAMLKSVCDKYHIESKQQDNNFGYR